MLSLSKINYYSDCLKQSFAKVKDEMSSLPEHDERYEMFKELHEIMLQIDFSVFESKDDNHENENTPSTPKRRKTSRSGSENNELAEKQQKSLEEIKKQFNLIKRAAYLAYELENTHIKMFISKDGKKRKNVPSKVNFFKKIHDYGQILPLWISLETETPPALCGAIEADETYIAEKGDLVAALVTQNKKENWILAEVTTYNPDTKEYTVDDIYEEPKAEQILSWNKVIPLPKMKVCPKLYPEATFQKNAPVLALYPGTTCFYRAVVAEPPETYKDPYKLLFEDENYETGFSSSIPVHQCYVIYDKSNSNDEECDK